MDSPLLREDGETWTPSWGSARKRAKMRVHIHGWHHIRFSLARPCALGYRDTCSS